jgi:hypothetical protein
MLRKQPQPPEGERAGGDPPSSTWWAPLVEALGSLQEHRWRQPVLDRRSVQLQVAAAMTRASDMAQVRTTWEHQHPGRAPT